ncbi:hypothetical protein [Bifidobacterium vespertilionis]|uniref:hypothetical protein n=1 Tax=Bifidobacterium vespertilionis TaxID=2562524 RepID=UPI001BDCC91A|nr:hypothetical protein [Bifidobacterium vespertilionis]MBT1179038.1 hypothetical protein [Bifidobacterium vespertilionis]
MTTTPSSSNARHGTLRRAAELLSCVGLLVSLTACSTPWSGNDTGDAQSSGARIAPSMSALFDQYLTKDTLSQFERDVLQRAKKTGKISAEDYETAHGKQAACMAENGWQEQTRKLSNGLYQTTGVTPVPSTDAEVNKYMEASNTCSEGTSKIIESLYQLQQGNPGLLADPYETAVECLKKSNLVDNAYTGRKLENALNGDGTSKGLPFDATSDAAQSCFTGAGLAVNIG